MESEFIHDRRFPESFADAQRAETTDAGLLPNGLVVEPRNRHSRGTAKRFFGRFCVHKRDVKKNWNFAAPISLKTRC